MLQYPTVAEDFSASKLPCLLPCHGETEGGNEDESPVRSTDQEGNGLSEDLLGYSSPSSFSLLENTGARKNLDRLKEGNCEKEKEESGRGKGEQEEGEEGKDLPCEENDGEMNARCHIRNKYPLEIHLALFVNPIEIRSSTETVTIKKQSTEWMMELSSLLKILHHTPVEVISLSHSSLYLRSLFSARLFHSHRPSIDDATSVPPFSFSLCHVSREDMDIYTDVLYFSLFLSRVSASSFRLASSSSRSPSFTGATGELTDEARSGSTCMFVSTTN